MKIRFDIMEGEEQNPWTGKFKTEEEAEKWENSRLVKKWKEEGKKFVKVIC